MHLTGVRFMFMFLLHLIKRVISNLPILATSHLTKMDLLATMCLLELTHSIQSDIILSFSNQLTLVSHGLSNHFLISETLLYGVIMQIFLFQLQADNYS